MLWNNSHIFCARYTCSIMLPEGSWIIQKSIINAEKHTNPTYSTLFCLLTSRFFYYPCWTAHLTGSEYDPVVVLRSIFFDFLWLLSSYTHSYWTQVLICPKIVPVFLYMTAGGKKKSLTSYISTVFSCLIITLEVNCQLHGVNKNKSSSGTRMSFLCFTSLVYFIQKGWNSTWHLCLNRPKTRYTSYISFYSAICFIHIELNKYNQFSPLKIKTRKSNAPKWETQQPMLK